jgi:hypothetical protein
MNNPVLVKSKTVNNVAVAVVFQVIDKQYGDDPNSRDIRELSRTYTFKNFESRIPLKMAKILIKKRPEEFTIVKSIDDNPEIEKEIKDVMGVAKRKAEGYNCDKCEKSFKGAGALSLHKYNAHTKKGE